MSLMGCEHLRTFKRTNKNKSRFRWLHAVFVVNSGAHSLRTKLGNGRCCVCRKRGPFLHACLECVHFACHRHIREHARQLRHSITVDLTYGQTHCYQCRDYIYDAEIDAIAMDNRLKSKRLRRRLFEVDVCSTTNEERLFLARHTRRIFINPESTVGLRGLLNLGATCFMNCIVQALMHTPLLRDYFLTQMHRCRRDAKACLICQVSKLFQEFYNGTQVPLALDEWLHLIWKHSSHLAHNAQQDAHEFFMVTLDLLHKHYLETMPVLKAAILARQTGCPCIIHQIFTGCLKSDVVCQKCNLVSTTVDPTSDFSLDLEQRVSLDGKPPSSLVDCLERFTRAETICKYHCSNCESEQESTKQLTMKSLPIVISFHLKRFERCGDGTVKISTKISFPEMLDMKPFMSSSDVESPFPSDNRYTLFAVVNHIGQSMNQGHYISYVRKLQDNWYKCDDEVITRATLSEVLASEAYMLFYHKHVLEYE